MAEPTFFTHNEIAGVLTDVVPFNNFLLNFFGVEHIVDDEQINFDKIAQDNRISVFVNPRRPGEIVKDRGFAVRSYKPGYIKDKVTVDHKHVFTRRPGEPFNSNMTKAQRYAATVADLARQQTDRLYRRLEWMAAQFIQAGKYTMTGDGISVEVDFARNSANTIALTSTARWLDANTSVSPIDDLEKWINLCVEPVRTIVMGNAAWRSVRRDPKFDKLIYISLKSNGTTGLVYGPQQQNKTGVTYRGTLLGSGIELYTYSRTYTDPDTGNETLFLPTDGVMGLPETGFGVQCYASILDVAAGYQGMPYFFKNWQEDDPGIPYLMLQSAPMLAHTKINSTFYAATAATATGA